MRRVLSSYKYSVASFSLLLYVLDISEKPRRFSFAGTLFSLFKSDGFTVAFL